MGGNFGSPDFSVALQLVSYLMSDTRYTAMYPLTESVTQMIQHKTILELLMNPDEADNKQMQQTINAMCTNNPGLTREVAYHLFKTTLTSNNRNIKEAWK